MVIPHFIEDGLFRVQLLLLLVVVADLQADPKLNLPADGR